MSKFEATVSLELDVTVPVNVDTRAEVEEAVENMSLSEFLDWSGCASFNMNILTIQEHDDG